MVPLATPQRAALSRTAAAVPREREVLGQMTGI